MARYIKYSRAMVHTRDFWTSAVSARIYPLAADRCISLSSPNLIYPRSRPARVSVFPARVHATCEQNVSIVRTVAVGGSWGPTSCRSARSAQSGPGRSRLRPPDRVGSGQAAGGGSARVGGTRSVIGEVGGEVAARRVSA